VGNFFPGNAERGKPKSNLFEYCLALIAIENVEKSLDKIPVEFMERKN